MRYGQQTFTSEPIGNFQGNFNDASLKSEAPTFFDRLLKKAKKEVSDAIKATPVDAKKHISAVSSRDAKMHHMYSKLQSAPGHKITLDLSTELNQRMRTDHIFEDLVPHHLRASADPVRPRNFDCLKSAVNTYEKHCGRFSDYDLKYVRQLVILCESQES